MSNDGLTQSGTGCFIAFVLPCGNSGRQRVKLKAELLDTNNEKNDA